MKQNENGVIEMSCGEVGDILLAGMWWWHIVRIASEFVEAMEFTDVASMVQSIGEWKEALDHVHDLLGKIELPSWIVQDWPTREQVEEMHKALTNIMSVVPSGLDWSKGIPSDDRIPAKLECVIIDYLTQISPLRYTVQNGAGGNGATPEEYESAKTEQKG